MKSEPTDGYFDHFMVFMSNHAKDIAEEWFRLCQRMFLLSGLYFLKEQLSEWIFGLLFFISCIVLFIYYIFHYQNMWHECSNKLQKKYKMNWLTKILTHNLGVFIATCVSNLLIFGSIGIAIEASKLLYKN